MRNNYPGEPEVFRERLLATTVDANYGKGLDNHGARTGVAEVIGTSQRIRRFSPVETERLQGFPDDWTVGSDTQRYKQTGNAVTTNVVYAVAYRLFEGILSK